MAESEAVDILVQAIDYHSNDPNVLGSAMYKRKLLVQGPKAIRLDSSDYVFNLKAEAAITITASVLQLLLALCGLFCGRVLPDWGFSRSEHAALSQAGALVLQGADVCQHHLQRCQQLR
jgi:hypothetical protein